MINYQLSINIISKVSTNKVLDAELKNQHHYQLSIIKNDKQSIKIISKISTNMMTKKYQDYPNPHSSPVIDIVFSPVLFINRPVIVAVNHPVDPQHV